jgi:hypothetical protein
MAYTIITQEVYDQFPNGIPHDQFQNYDSYVQFNAAQTFPGPPTPPGQHLVHAAVHSRNGVVHQPAAAVSTADLLAISKAEVEELNRRQGGSNSEDDDLTPAQSRRKAQNRAAYVVVKLHPPFYTNPMCSCRLHHPLTTYRSTRFNVTLQPCI